MEFSCSREDLYSGVQVVERIVATRSTLPIIVNILFEAGKNNLKMSANNLELGIEITIPAKVDKAGSILVPAKTLGEIVSRLPSGDVNFRVSEKGVIRISYKQSNFNIHGLSPDEFPMLPKLSETKNFNLDPELFANMVKQTIFSVSLSEEKYVLNGALIELGKSNIPGDTSNIRLVATDGYRLARSGDKISPAPSGSTTMIVPAKALNELLRILESGKEKELAVMLSSDQIAFKYKNAYLVSRLIQGQFPDYKQVIPKTSEIKVSIDTASFLEACERAAVIASSSAHIVKLELKGHKLHVVANTPDVGSVDEVVDVEVKGGEKAQIAFNVKLITDALKVIDADRVTLELAGPLSPGVLKPEGETDYIYIIMPIRTTETTG